MTHSQFVDDVLQDIKQRAKTAPRYKAGELVMYISNSGQLDPMQIVGVVDNAYWDGHGYGITSVVYPHAGEMFVHENWLRPMLRTRFELRQTMRIIKCQ